MADVTKQFVKFWHGTENAYNAIESKDSNTLYFITNSGKLYKGTDEIANKTTDTHYSSKNIVGGSATAATNGKVEGSGGVYLNHIESNSDTPTSSHRIVGSGKITVTSDESGNITIDGAKTTLSDLGLDNAIHFRGVSSTSITNGGTQTPTISGVDFTANPLKNGDVVLYGKQEFIYSGGKWALFGDEGSYALKTRSITAGAGVKFIVDEADATSATLAKDFTIANTGVTSVGKGSANGTIAVSVGGAAATDVAVQGLAAAAYKEVSDSSSASALKSSGTNLVTERDVYHGLPKINNAHNYTSNSTFYAPTGGGTAGYVLQSNGGTSAPTWVAIDTLVPVSYLEWSTS